MLVGRFDTTLEYSMHMVVMLSRDITWYRSRNQSRV